MLAVIMAIVSVMKEGTALGRQSPPSLLTKGRLKGGRQQSGGAPEEVGRGYVSVAKITSGDE